MLTACSDIRDAAREEPVDPVAGLYAVSVSSGGFFGQGAGEREAEHCLRESGRSRFPHDLMETVFKLHYACGAHPGVREGNEVSGEVKCRADPKLARGMNRFIYEGEVANDEMWLEARIKFDAEFKDGVMTEKEKLSVKFAMKAIEHVRIEVEAEHVGDC